MFGVKISGVGVTLALAGLLAVAPASEAQEDASIQSQCRHEAQDYGIEPEQLEEYVSGCVQAYGGVPEEAAPRPEQAQPADADAEAPVDVDPDMGDSGEQDPDATVE